MEYLGGLETVLYDGGLLRVLLVLTIQSIQICSFYRFYSDLIKADTTQNYVYLSLLN